MAEMLSFIEYASGTATIVGSGSEITLFSESTAGVTVSMGVSHETLALTECVSGRVDTSGASREALVFAEHVTGAVVATGMSREKLSFAEFATSGITGTGTEVLAFGERVIGYSLVSAVSREAISFSESIRGSLIETHDGVWVVNLATGGHSRYTGDLTGATPVEAYALTPVHQLGSDRAKYVPDLYVHMRTDGELEITTITDEQQICSGYNIPTDGREGMHRRRVKLAKGVKGTNWQFKIANRNGSACDIQSLEPRPAVSQRVR